MLLLITSEDSAGGLIFHFSSTELTGLNKFSVKLWCEMECYPLNAAPLSFRIGRRVKVLWSREHDRIPGVIDDYNQVIFHP
jgi:hypothetical protein